MFYEVKHKYLQILQSLEDNAQQNDKPYKNLQASKQ